MFSFRKTTLRSKKKKSKKLFFSLIISIVVLWCALLGWSIAHASDRNSLSPDIGNKSVDAATGQYQVGEELYLENCSGCHLPLPPAVLPTETWKGILERPQDHYGEKIDSLIRLTQVLIWNYLSAYSRGLLKDEVKPEYIAQSRYFYALHPQVDLPNPVTHRSCLGCHPQAMEFDYRTSKNQLHQSIREAKMKSPPDRIIVPLDVPDGQDAIALIDLLPEVSFWKVGLELFVAAGADILKLLKDRGKRIFLDLKFHDIPNTLRGAIQGALQYDVDLLSVHATAGRRALAAARQAVGEREKPKLIAITLLTSINSRELAIDLQIPLELPEYTLHNAILAKESGLDGVVCSPQEASQLRQVCGPDFLLVCPGVRPTWAEMGDHKRVMAPRQALDSGADFLVIGRPITQSDNPPLAWQKICEELL